MSTTDLASLTTLRLGGPALLAVPFADARLEVPGATMGLRAFLNHAIGSQLSELSPRLSR